MRYLLMSAFSAAAVCAIAASTPAIAQATVAGAPAGSAPVTVEGYGFGPGQPGQPGIGNNPPGFYYGPGYGYYGPGYGHYAPGYAGPFGAVTAGAVGAPLGGPAYPLRRHHCHVYRDSAGRRICGP